MSRYADRRPACAEDSAAANGIGDRTESITAQARALRARAARYARLAEILADSRCIAVARATARELEEEAALLERQHARHMRLSA
jgi:hypothetical protein